MSWTAVIAAAGSVLGAGISSQGSKAAANTQSQAAKAASDAQLYMFGRTRDDLAPYMDVGRVALKSLAAGLGLDKGAAGEGSMLKPFGLDDFQESPAYKFNLEQGQKAIDKAAASRGRFYAPATLQDVAKFSQGLASNEFQNAFNNYNTNMRNVWERLYSLSSGGQNAAANLGGFGTTVGGQVGSNMIGAGNALAAGQVGQANAWTGALNNMFNNYQMQQALANNQQSTVPGGDVRYIEQGMP